MSAYPSAQDRHFQEAHLRFEKLLQRVASNSVMNMEHQEVETLVEKDGREILCAIFQGHLDLRAVAEKEREAPTGADGVQRRHRRGTERKLEGLFGTAHVHRIDFTAREANGGLRPLDAELNLPRDLYSLGVRYRAAIMAMDMSFEAAQTKLHGGLGIHIPKRQLEGLIVKAAQDFEDFYIHRQQGFIEQNGMDREDELLVLTADGKGIVMRREALRDATQKKAEAERHKLSTRLSPGEKRNRKRMAEVASVYGLLPRARSPADILPRPEEREAHRPSPLRPRPKNKRVWASVDRSLEEVLEQCFAEALSRDPWVKRPWVYLVDGNNDQIRIGASIARDFGARLVIIIDFIHVLEYLWKAAWCFFEKGDPGVEAWVLERARKLLEGKSSEVAAGIRRIATARELDVEARKGADRCADYLLKKSPYLRYDEYLSLGMPIATGVIEGACRHLIQDRLGLTGCRWGVLGAESILRLRGLRSSGDFAEYWSFHCEREQARNHLVHYASSESVELRMAA